MVVGHRLTNLIEGRKKRKRNLMKMLKMTRHLIVVMFLVAVLIGNLTGAVAAADEATSAAENVSAAEATPPPADEPAAEETAPAAETEAPVDEPAAEDESKPTAEGPAPDDEKTPESAESKDG